MQYEEFKDYNPETQKIMSSLMEKAGLKNIFTREDFERYFVAVVDAFLDYKLSVDDLAMFFGMLESSYSDRFDAHLGNDKLYTRFYEGSDIDWALRGREAYTSGLEDILNYAKELRGKYNGEPSSN